MTEKPPAVEETTARTLAEEEVGGGAATEMAEVVRRRSAARRVVEFAFFVGALALLAVLLHRIGWQDVGAALMRVGLLGGLVMVLIGFAETLLDAMALHAAMLRRLGLDRVLYANCAGSVVNNFAPWDLGEVVKGAIMGRRGSAANAISAVVVWNYAFKLTRPAVSLGLAVVGAILWTGAPDGIVGVVLAANLLAFVPYIVFRLVLKAGPARLLTRAVSLLPWLRERGQSWLQSALEIDDAVISFSTKHPALYRRVIASQFAARIVSFLALYVAARLVGLDYGMAQLALVYGGLNVADYVIAALPARLGVSEGAAYVIFQVYGLSAEAGLIVYLVLRLKMLLSNGLPAAFAFYALRRNEPGFQEA